MPYANDHIKAVLADSAKTIASLQESADHLHQIGLALRQTLDQGNTVFTCGNGGSAAEAMHLAEELIGKYNAPRPPLRGLCLNADPTAITCIANDFGYEEVFARQLAGLSRPGDTLVVFSTSGKSPNILRALQTAHEHNVTTIGLLGKTGGQCAELCDHTLIVPSNSTARIQEAHQVIVHLLLDAAET